MNQHQAERSFLDQACSVDEILESLKAIGDPIIMEVLESGALETFQKGYVPHLGQYFNEGQIIDNHAGFARAEEVYQVRSEQTKMTGLAYKLISNGLSGKNLQIKSRIEEAIHSTGLSLDQFKDLRDTIVEG